MRGMAKGETVYDAEEAGRLLVDFAQDMKLAKPPRDAFGPLLAQLASALLSVGIGAHFDAKAMDVEIEMKAADGEKLGVRVSIASGGRELVVNGGPPFELVEGILWNALEKRFEGPRVAGPDGKIVRRSPLAVLTETVLKRLGQ